MRADSCVTTAAEAKQARKQRQRKARTEDRKKKSAKSEAKQARRENGIAHRKATRNDAKYAKNKDFKKQLVLDLERRRIRSEALKQAEALAAKHDRSGKLFGVSEIVEVGEAGEVISRDGQERRAAERKWDEWAAEQKLSQKAKKNKKLDWLVGQPVPNKPFIPDGYSVPEGDEDFVQLWDITDEEIKRRLGNAKGEKKKAGNARAKEVKSTLR